MVRSCQQGLVMALKRGDVRKSFKRKNLHKIFVDEQLIRRLHFISYSKQAKKFTLPKNITDFSLAQVLCDLHCMMNKSRTPYLHCKSAMRYRSTAIGADPPQQVSEAALSTASLKIGT